MSDREQLDVAWDRIYHEIVSEHPDWHSRDVYKEHARRLQGWRSVRDRQDALLESQVKVARLMSCGPLEATDGDGF